MDQKFYIFHLTHHTGRNDTAQHMRALSSHGYAVKACAALPALVECIAALQLQANDRVVAVVDGRDPGSATAVSTLRALRSGLGIVVVAERDDDASMTLLLQLGADTCCFPCASADLWVATVSRLLWRLATPRQSRAITASNTVNAAWVLEKQGWAMRTPAGQLISLTTGERAFLMTLLSAPLKQVSHEELISAVNASYKASSARTSQRRLGVMVSRMRRKFSEQGSPLPLKSVHNWGYMFVGDS